VGVTERCYASDVPDSPTPALTRPPAARHDSVSSRRPAPGTVVDGIEGSFDSFSDGTAGFSATALAGMPVCESRWGFDLHAGAGAGHYGSTGINIRLGVDLQPWFLERWQPGG